MLKMRKNLKRIKRKQSVMHKGLQTDFSAETLQTRRELDRIFKMLKEKTSNREYSTKLSFRTEENRDSPKRKSKKKVHHH